MPRKKLASKNVSRILRGEIIDEVYKRSNTTLIPKEETIYGVKLNEMGRQSYYSEYFDGILFENQVFPKIGPFEDPTKTVSFKEGYKRGEFLVRNGIMTEEKYNTEKNTKNSVRR